jgi:hypothetical protein
MLAALGIVWRYRRRAIGMAPSQGFLSRRLGPLRAFPQGNCLANTNSDRCRRAANQQEDKT